MKKIYDFLPPGLSSVYTFTVDIHRFTHKGQSWHNLCLLHLSLALINPFCYIFSDSTPPRQHLAYPLSPTRQQSSEFYLTPLPPSVSNSQHLAYPLPPSSGWRNMWRAPYQMTTQYQYANPWPIHQPNANLGTNHLSSANIPNYDQALSNLPIFGQSNKPMPLLR